MLFPREFRLCHFHDDHGNYHLRLFAISGLCYFRLLQVPAASGYIRVVPSIDFRDTFSFFPPFLIIFYVLSEGTEVVFDPEMEKKTIKIRSNV
jgi:hypothetical protein